MVSHGCSKGLARAAVLLETRLEKDQFQLTWVVSRTQFLAVAGLRASVSCWVLVRNYCQQLGVTCSLCHMGFLSLATGFLQAITGGIRVLLGGCHHLVSHNPIHILTYTLHLWHVLLVRSKSRQVPATLRRGEDSRA